MPFKKPHHTSDPDCVIPHPQVGGGYLIKPRGLNIVWGNDSRYWKLHGDTAELIQVSWLEVSGIVPVTKNKKYNVRFHVNVKVHGFGWNNTQVLVMAKVGKKGSYKFSEATLKPGDKNLTIPLEIEVDAKASDTNLHFGLYEVWSGKWKGGLEIIDAEVSGGYLIKPRGLNIVWGNDSRYWKLHGDTAELIQVSWLEVSGIVPVTKNKKYNVRFHVNVKVHGFGWNNTQVLVMAKVGKKGSYKFSEATLKPGDKNLTIPLEIEVDANASDTNLHFGLYEVWSGKWKGGLEIIDAEVVPVN